MAREIMGGWENGTIPGDGFTEVGSGAITTTAANLHKDRAGGGSSYALIGTGGANPARIWFQQYQNVRSLVDCWDRDMVKILGTGGGGGRVYNHVFFSGATELASVAIDNTTQVVSLYRSTGTLLASSAAAVCPVGSYFILDIHFRMLDAGGLFEVFVNGVSVVSFAGDTKPGTETTFNSLGFANTANIVVDEYARNSITVGYITTAGVFAAGDTITGSISGATAVVTSAETTVLVLRTWSGTSFIDGETVTGSVSLATGLVSAPTPKYLNGLQPNSQRIGVGFVVALPPIGPGFTTQLTSSTGGANWTTVDDIPVNTTDWNMGSAADLYDTYDMTNLSSAVVTIVAVAGCLYAQRDGSTISNARHVVRINGVDYFGSNTLIPTSFASLWWVWSVNPATQDQWTRQMVNNAEFGPQART